ncbi:MULTISPECIES: Gfo/Idh/MocA family oxidoreductase [unclassified Caballeronia]|uniref:Gfo/Idh/MocA family protein n=1 Tax=unclassified Caballeronia TaxID=2646786 RepID=UPI0028644ADC|nr:MULTISPECIES: Gfo/Idh/MocA family oxidoreductase [unclassified Caballeronia]MDR5773245.1 Gfo/Idh/MocA family oxidoreductase [Caballeronia sp. LZ002]MDR5848679.1 Gfo/Idh/MocA family oxidoreductase [Caballeronia sp. LZ003]
MQETVRWGVLGAAKIADKFMVPAIQRSSNGRVVCVAARDRERAAAFAARHDIAHAYASYDEVLASDQVDAIYIPLPTASHFEWCKKALLAGKHVLCEKPIAMTASQVRELIALRDSTGLVCGEAFMVAHHPQWAFVQECIARGTLGELRLVEGSFTYFNDDPHALKNDLALGGGGVRDIGVYPVVTTRMVTGLEPLAIGADITIDPRYGTDKLAVCDLTFAGFDLHFYCGTQLARRQHMIFHGSKGWLSLDAPFNPGVYGDAKVHIRLDGTGKAETIEFGDVDQYQSMVENFGAAVLRPGEPLSFTLENSLGNQLVIDEVLSHANR